MKLGLTINGIYDTDGLPGFDFVSCLDGDRREFAIESEISAMLDKYALVIAWHHDDALDVSVEYGLGGSPLADGDVDSVVERKLDGFIDRVVMLAIMVRNVA